jgi:hypothetical protein
LIVVGLAALAYQGDEGTRAARASWALVLFTRRHIERDDGASDGGGDRGDRGYSDVGTAEPVAIKPRVCDADKQVVPTLLTRPTSLDMTHTPSVRVPPACHSKPWE